MQTIVLHFSLFCLATPLLDCLFHILFVKLCLHTNKRRPCSSTLSGHPSSSYIYIYHYVFDCICIYLFHRFRSSDAVGNGLKNNTHLPQRQSMPLFEMIWKKQLKAMHRITPYAFEQFQWHVSYKALRRWIWHHAVMLHWTGPRGIGAIHAGNSWILNVVKPTIN